MLPIVIVDDFLEDALLAQRTIGLCKIQNPVVLLKSGQACLDYFRGTEPHQDRVLPCVLLLDMMMSPVSGLDVLRKIRDDRMGRGSVVVMLSGLADLKAIHDGYQLGANTFLVKPLLAEDVMQMVRAIPKIGVHRVSHGYELFLADPAKTRRPDDTPTYPDLRA